MPTDPWVARKDRERAQRRADDGAQARHWIASQLHERLIQLAPDDLVMDVMMHCRCPKCGEYWWWSVDGACGGCGYQAVIFTEVS